MNVKIFFISCAALVLSAVSGSTAQPGPFYSQYEQDRFVYENFFTKSTSGVFVDIGAHDGKTINNTKFFEDSLNWTGICIEPIPEIFEQLQKNRKATCIQGCVSNQERMAKFIRFKGGYFGEMFSGLQDTYPSESFDAVSKSIDSEIIDVQCFLLNNILEKNGITHVDYLSIDTEGGELDILKSIDFMKFDIQIIGVENNSGSRSINDFLSRQGYFFVRRVGIDDIFTKVHR